MEMPPASDIKLPPDLEKQRDDKVVPVAREILKDMVQGLLPENADDPAAMNPLLLDILKKMLDADMNITLEAQYVFQLLIAGFSGLNTTLHSLECEPTDDARYRGIAKKILQIFSDANVRFTTVTPEESAADFAEAKVKLQELFTAEKLTKLELRYIMDNVFDAIKSVNNSISESLAQSTDKAEAKVFGIESMSDLRLSHINKVLIHDITVSFARPAEVVQKDAQTAPGGDGQAMPPAAEEVEKKESEQA